jgi:hypothetical protein
MPNVKKLAAELKSGLTGKIIDRIQEKFLITRRKVL